MRELLPMSMPHQYSFEDAMVGHTALRSDDNSWKRIDTAESTTLQQETLSSERLCTIADFIRCTSLDFATSLQDLRQS
jgi:hypothetical protein